MAWRARAGVLAGALVWWLAVRAAVAAAARVLPLVAHGASPGPPPADPGPLLDDALAGLAGLGSLALLGWLGLAVACAVLAEALPAGCAIARHARQLSDRVTPVAVRRALTLVVGAALVSAAVPAQAATGAGATRQMSSSTLSRAGRALPGAISPTSPTEPERGWFTPASAHSGRAAAPSAAATAEVDPAWGATESARRPERVASRGPAVAPGAAARTAAGPATVRSAGPLPDLDPGWAPPGRLRPGVPPQQAVVVRRGDTLWDLAARHLGHGATDAEIAQAWPHWFTANRSVIGPDPNLLEPGQSLTPPDPAPRGAA
jgi:resuscitation-promoting factor RpfA